MKELFEQHPLPWRFDDSRAHEQYICVLDAAGGAILSCTPTQSNVVLAKAIAALPELLESNERGAQHLIAAHARELWGMHGSYTLEKAQKVAEQNPPAIVVELQTALAKARGEG